MESIENYMNEKYAVKDEIYNAIKDSIFCPICNDVMITPIMCMKCQNSFCRKCIENWEKFNKKCPNRCANPEYKKSLFISQILSKIKFECKDCNSILNYDEMKKHFYSKCETEKLEIELYNYERQLSSQGIFEKLEEKNQKSEPKNKIKSKI